MRTSLSSKSLKNSNYTSPTAGTRITIVKVSQASEFPSAKKLPKFRHVPLAVINPSPSKVRRPSTSPSFNLELTSSKLKLKQRTTSAKELPEHLTRAPIDTNVIHKPPKPFVNVEGMTNMQKKKVLEESAKLQADQLKEKKALKNLTSIFIAIKQALDKSQDHEVLHTAIQENVGNLKLLLNSRRFISALYQDFVQDEESIPNRQEFQRFVKLFVPGMLESDIHDILTTYSKNRNDKNDLASVHRDLRLDIQVIDTLFDEWLIKNEALNGVLNPKLTKTKNLEFRQTMEAWKRRVAERKRIKERTYEQGKKIREFFKRFLLDFTTSKDQIRECQIQYESLVDDLNNFRKQEKMANDLFSQLPEASVVEVSQIERLIEHLQDIFMKQIGIMQKFADWVSHDCVLNRHYFSFFDIPQLIVNKKVSKRDYEVVSKLLVKVKRKYLVHKANLLSDKPLEQVTLTDQDMVPLEMFTVVISQIKNTWNERKSYWQSMLASVRAETQQKIKSLNVDTQKKISQVQDSVLIGFLTSRLEDVHETSFNNHYKHELIYRDVVRKQNEIKKAEKLVEMFNRCIDLCQVDQLEHRMQLQREMNRFNGKITSEETASVTSSVSGGKQKKVMTQPSFVENNKSVDLNDRSMNSQSSFQRGLKEIDGQSDYENLMDRTQTEQEKHELHMKEMFKQGSKGEYFNPQKKFGVIEGGDQVLVYDKVTTSYPLNLPSDYYNRQIQSSMPNDKEDPYYLRPHHVANLTQHVRSIKDDVLNTRYFSHYNQENGKVQEKNDCETAIDYIEQSLQKLKFQQEQLVRQRGLHFNEQEKEKLRQEQEKEARVLFQKFINDRERKESKAELLIETYENILHENRLKERDLLNKKRNEEIQKNRPPQHEWYKLKTKQFSDEAYRNRISLKPHNENIKYLQKLKDPYLY